MKKLFLFLISILVLSNAYAMNPADFLNKIPENFTPECYEYYNKIDKALVRDNDEKYQTYKININETKDLVITQYGFILPYKYYSSNTSDIYNYENNIWWENIKYLTDYNYNTFFELDSKTNDEIILSFREKLEAKNFSFIFNYNADNLKAEYYISDNNINWDLIKEENMSDFSFSYLKIKFINKSPIDSRSYRENIKVYELNFPKKSNTILVKSFYNDDIEIYSTYNCSEQNFSTSFKSYDLFSINSDTETLDIKSEQNPKYNVYTKKDYDNDWVEDSIDNCIYRYNPNQTDTNWDGKWDACMDDDKDWIIWFYDNCVQIYNPDQKDVNRNNVWDVCEFDKDGDSIFDSIDNCITIPNLDQKDSDKDGIWDACDNCKSYNPSQRDFNENGIWDVCEEIEKNLAENDNDEDEIINSKDNCKNIFNPEQLDSDKDWIGDLCDNCVQIQNPKQIDENKNGVWDMCEDSDWDNIVWYLDNCLNVKNENQEDSDNDGTWNVCEDDDGDNIIYANDNCPNTYNPDQIDIDKDGLWDKCDDKDNRYIESNSNFFIALFVFITIAFFFGTYLMIRKLK